MTKKGRLSTACRQLCCYLLLFAMSGWQPAEAQQLPWDLSTLYAAPAVQWESTDAAVYSLRYRSINIKGRPTQVFAFFSDPDIIEGKKSSGRKFPAVVLVHGGGGKAFPQWVAKWAKEGYAALAMDLGGKDGQGRPLEQAGPDQSFESKWTNFSRQQMHDSWNHFSVASVILAHSLLRSFPQTDTMRTFITGISWGGYLTCIVAALDTRFKAAAPVYGCGFYDESDAFKKSMSVLQEDDRKAWLTYYDPSVYMGRANIPILYLNGNKDEYYNIVPFHKTYTLIPAQQRWLRIMPDMKHGHSDGWNPPEIRAFFEQVATGIRTLPKIGAPVLHKRKQRITVSYTAPRRLVSAQWWYSNDSHSLNKDRRWTVADAVIDHRKQQLSCHLPGSELRYGFFVAKDEQGMILSSEILLR